ncbi:MAG: DNA alkylation repair protein [Holophagales bacterium]|nr:DNA alkylation repair protein [Holophagales bacterium]
MDYEKALGRLRALAAESGPPADGDAPGRKSRESAVDMLAREISRRATHSLAVELWRSGDSDARSLATRLADPEALGAEGLDTWLRELEGSRALEAFVDHLALFSPQAHTLMVRWAADENQMVQRCGYRMVARLAQDDPDLDDRLLEEKLRAIEEHVATSKAEAKKAISKALVTIGQRNDRLAALAIDVARRLGPIEIEIESGRLRADPVKLLEDPELARRLLD